MIPVHPSVPSSPGDPVSIFAGFAMQLRNALYINGLSDIRSPCANPYVSVGGRRIKASKAQKYYCGLPDFPFFLYGLDAILFSRPKGVNLNG